MKEIFKQARMDMLFTSALCIVFGIVLIWKPLETVALFCQILAIGLIIVGVLLAGSYLLSFATSGASLGFGMVLAILGVVLVFNPGIVEAMIPVIIGIVLLFHGVEEIKMAKESKGYGYAGWGRQLVFAIITILFAIICIADAFTVVQGAMILLGVALIYNGLSNIFITRSATKVFRDHEQKEKEEKEKKEKETIDGSFKED